MGALIRAEGREATAHPGVPEGLSLVPCLQASEAGVGFLATTG